MDPKVTILGFGIKGDFQTLGKTLPYAFGDLDRRSESVLDIEIFERLATGATYQIMRR